MGIKSSITHEETQSFNHESSFSIHNIEVPYNGRVLSKTCVLSWLVFWTGPHWVWVSNYFHCEEHGVADLKIKCIT